MISDGQDSYVFENLSADKKYLLCESEPAKGYVYDKRVAYLVDRNTYDEQILSFRNLKRDYTLRLYKESEDHQILLNGALFEISYSDGDEERHYRFMSGALNIPREEGMNYLIYRKKGSDEIVVEEFKDDQFIKENVEEGTYFYYQSADNTVDEKKLEDRYVRVIKGAYEIIDIPYDASIEISEIKAPKGYYISEADFSIVPNLAYSDIIFNNSRVNYFEIIPENRHQIPKTCIGG